MATIKISLDPTMNPSPCDVDPGDTIIFETSTPETFYIMFEKDSAFSNNAFKVTSGTPGSLDISKEATSKIKYYSLGLSNGSTFKVAAPPRIIIH